MQTSVAALVLALCFALAAANFVTDDEAIWDFEDAAEPFEEEKRVSQPLNAADLLVARESDHVVDRRRVYLCVNPATNKLCWCDRNQRGASRYRVCGLRLNSED
ncbi:uncharacterized protein [Diadema setosum]|uniref:uncharacterized protein n=1 Tax=Diadema setosum TaxID=31175 RepID=UPI003B3AE670